MSIASQRIAEAKANRESKPVTGNETLAYIKLAVNGHQFGSIRVTLDKSNFTTAKEHMLQQQIIEQFEKGGSLENLSKLVTVSDIHIVGATSDEEINIEF